MQSAHVLCYRHVPTSLFKVRICLFAEPLKLNFGKVVVKSLIGKAMQVKNLSRRHISVKVEVSWVVVLGE